ncbi:MAG TPA: hypothetical protein VKZ63_00490 [Kofleriaceae bacterium]|nr:hypothetical protein [Kofleriaceae bacterium]
MEILGTVSSLSIVAFAVSSMLMAGVSFTLGEIVAPLREPNRIARALAGNFVLVPLLAAALAAAFSLEPGLALALILLGTAAGAPFLVKLLVIADGDVAMGTGLLVLLIPVTVLFMPLVVPVLAPEASVNAAAIAVPLALTMVLPLAIGLGLNEVAPGWATRLRPVARAVSTVALVLLLVTTLLVHLGGLAELFASRAMIAVVLFVLGSFAIGVLVASPHPERRIVLGLGTALRNIAAATVVASDLDDPDTLVLVVVASIVALLVLIPVARWLRRRSGGEAAAQRGAWSRPGAPRPGPERAERSARHRR